MDKSKDQRSTWAWLPAAMPGVARLMADRRRQHGDAHVNTCWKRGVIDGEPGWFFAREGALSVGTPWAEMADAAWWQVTRTQATVIMKVPGHGTH